MTESPTPVGVLAGVKVLDLTRILAGPSATQILGDLGADVVKVERPGTGDDTRGWGPPFLKDLDGADTQESAYYLSANRNKRSITLDLETPRGAAVARRLAGEADILVENFKVGGLAQYGLDHASLRAAFPRLIYCSLTGFGQTGPYASRAGYDYLVQGLGGVMSITGEPDGMPVKVGVAVADIVSGLHAVIGIFAALRHRDQTGEGQHIDIALLDSTVSWLANQGSTYLTAGTVPTRLGNAHPTIVPYSVFATADGHIILAAGNDQQFARFCAVARLEGVAEDERFRANKGRVAHRTILEPMLAAAIATRTTSAWTAALEAVGVPASPINRIDEVFADPQVKARGMVIEMPHPVTDAGVKLVANPERMSATPPTYRLPPPTLGQHTDAVLADWLGLGTDEIAGLRDAKAV